MEPILHPDCLHGTVMYPDVIVRPCDDGLSLEAQAILDNLVIFVDLSVLEDHDVVQIDARLPLRVPMDRRPAVLEFLARTNLLIRRGGFLMDPDQGRIRFRGETDVVAPDLRARRTSEAFTICCCLVDGYFPALVGVALRDLSPEEGMEQSVDDLWALAECAVERLQAHQAQQRPM